MPSARSWNDLFADPRFHWKEPDPGVARLAERWAQQGRRAVYDLGCGAGRHMAYLQTLGFRVVGSDVAANGLAACADMLRQADLPARLVRSDMTATPFADGVFDAGLATNVLNHNPRALLQQAVDEIHRVLAPGGEFYLTVLNTWDWRYGSGEEVEPDSFVLAEGPETGILHHFFSEPDLLNWLRAFDVISLERERGELQLSTRPEGGPVFRDAWAVLIRKP
ncbi:class I SAM-dependent methyltransferase [bacterium]|nr:class I SAM-dependent methyltransferase [bacterium]